MTLPPDPLPFRWNVAKRNELGSLIQGSRAELAAWISGQLTRSAGAKVVELGNAHPADWFFEELVGAAARILAHSDDGELFFVGRSPENFYDFLSGVFSGKSWGSRLQLLPFSAGTPTEFEQAIKIAAKRRTLERRLSSLGLGPHDIVKRRRPTVFVDIVASGDTLGNRVTFLHRWCGRQEQDWKQVRGKLRIVGLTERTKTSPKTRRWHQHARWTNLLPRHAIKNVSIPHSLFHYLGAGQSKMNASFAPSRWGDFSLRSPARDENTRMALQLARALHVAARRKGPRQTLAGLMAAQPAVREAWFRRLMREVIAR